MFVFKILTFLLINNLTNDIPQWNKLNLKLCTPIQVLVENSLLIYVLYILIYYQMVRTKFKTIQMISRDV